MKKISIIGAGGHTRSSLNLIRELGSDTSLTIYDDAYDPRVEELVDGIRVIGPIDEIPRDSIVFVSMGDNGKRREYMERFYDQLLKDNLIHPSALLEKGVVMGVANQIFAKVYINCHVRIGNNTIINTGAIVEHEAHIGSHSHISVGTKVCGRSRVGDNCLMGAGSTVIDKLSICDDVMIGAGAVVVENIVAPGTYVGVPARRIR